MNRDHDHDNAPGRIPESLIHAALDGELSDDVQHEIAQALQYDKSRHRELLDTADAIRALRSEVNIPDFSNTVLGELDRSHRFIPSSWQRLVRQSRMGIAAALLLSLLCVAGLQRVYPRLTTIGQQETPVRDVASAIQQDTQSVQSSIRDEVRIARSSLFPARVHAGVETPGRTGFSFSISSAHSPTQTPTLFSAGFDAVTLPSGSTVYFPSAEHGLIIRTGQVRNASWSGSWSPELLGSTSEYQGVRLLKDSNTNRKQEALELP